MRERWGLEEIVIWHERWSNRQRWWDRGSLVYLQNLFVGFLSINPVTQNQEANWPSRAEKRAEPIHPGSGLKHDHIPHPTIVQIMGRKGRQQAVAQHENRPKNPHYG